ncbi:hypothetical protein TNCT_690941 [Trichonephila clavata]|uniref:Uncharacterized protein n=1 Tax=Trichonephila clavata TaxID=2740835 RepID=A0A8X6IJI6_TRICU|nr:hypothetical protein TNCT_690941 [Trichonephila clavata]
MAYIGCLLSSTAVGCTPMFRCRCYKAGSRLFIAVCCRIVILFNPDDHRVARFIIVNDAVIRQAGLAIWRVPSVFKWSSISVGSC